MYCDHEMSRCQKWGGATYPPMILLMVLLSTTSNLSPSKIAMERTLAVAGDCERDKEGLWSVVTAYPANAGYLLSPYQQPPPSNRHLYFTYTLPSSILRKHQQRRFQTCMLGCPWAATEVVVGVKQGYEYSSV